MSKEIKNRGDDAAAELARQMEETRRRNEIERKQREALEKAKEAAKKSADGAEKPRRRASYSKGDGITNEKPKLPSALDPSIKVGRLGFRKIDSLAGDDAKKLKLDTDKLQLAFKDYKAKKKLGDQQLDAIKQHTKNWISSGMVELPFKTLPDVKIGAIVDQLAANKPLKPADAEAFGAHVQGWTTAVINAAAAATVSTKPGRLSRGEHLKGEVASEGIDEAKLQAEPGRASPGERLRAAAAGGYGAVGGLNAAPEPQKFKIGAGGALVVKNDGASDGSLSTGAARLRAAELEEIASASSASTAAPEWSADAPEQAAILGGQMLSSADDPNYDRAPDGWNGLAGAGGIGAAISGAEWLSSADDPNYDKAPEGWSGLGGANRISTGDDPDYDRMEDGIAYAGGSPTFDESAGGGPLGALGGGMGSLDGVSNLVEAGGDVADGVGAPELRSPDDAGGLDALGGASNAHDAGLVEDTDGVDASDPADELAALGGAAQANDADDVGNVDGTDAADDVSATSDADSAAPQGTEIPDDVQALLPDNPGAFQASYLKGLDEGEDWAVSLKAEGAQQQQQIAQELRGDDVQAPRGPRNRDDDGLKPADLAKEVSARVDAAAKANQPWALALKADQDAEVEAKKQAEIAKTLNTSFETGKPDTFTDADKKALKAFNKDPRKPYPLADDGSMKVPSPPEKGVNEYVRTNGQFAVMQIAGQDNIYNPLYSKYLADTIQAAGKDNGAPPQGKGFLACTEHGFAFIYDSKMSADENRMRAELSLKTGAPFDKITDQGKYLKEKLEKFDSFDPSKKGETVIDIDRNKHGWFRISLKSDGNGNVTSNTYFRPDRGEHFHDNVERYGLEVVALAATVVSGGAATPAVVALNSAVAAKGVYQAVKKGDWLGAVLSAAGAFASFGKFATDAAIAAKSAVPAWATVATNIGHAVTAYNAINTTVKAVQNGSISGAIAGLGSAAGEVASISVLPKNVSDAFKEVSKLAQKYGPIVGLGETAAKLIDKGDYVGALASAVQFAAKNYPKEFGIPADVADKVAKTAGVIAKVSDKVRSKDYTGAVSDLIGGARDIADPDKRNTFLGAGVAAAGVIDRLRKDDPAGAAKFAASFAGELYEAKQKAEAKAKDPSTPAEEKKGLAEFIDNAKKQIDRMGGYEQLSTKISGVLDAVKKGDTLGIAENVTDLLKDVTGKEGFGVASKLVTAARDAIDAVKSHDYVKIMAAGESLRQAMDDAHTYLDTNNKLPKKGEEPDEPTSLPIGKDFKDIALLAPGVDPSIKLAAPDTYVTKTGDDLPDLAEKLLGDSEKWPELYEYNKDALKNPQALKTGLELKIPPKDFEVPNDRRDQITNLKKGEADPAVDTKKTDGTDGITKADVMKLVKTTGDVLAKFGEIVKEGDDPDLAKTFSDAEKLTKAINAYITDGKADDPAVNQLYTQLKNLQTVSKFGAAVPHFVQSLAEAVGNPLKPDSAAVANLKEFGKAMKSLGNLTGPFTKALSITDDLCKAVTGFGADGKEVKNPADRLKAARNLATALPEYYDTIKPFLGTLEQLTRNVAPELSQALRNVLSKMPKGAAEAVSKGVADLLKKAAEKGASSETLQTICKTAANYLEGKAGQVAARAGAEEFVGGMFEVLGEALGLPVMLAYEGTKLNFEASMTIGANAYTALQTYYVNKAVGGDPAKLKSKLEMPATLDGQELRNYVSDSIVNAFRSTDPQVQKDWTSAVQNFLNARPAYEGIKLDKNKQIADILKGVDDGSMIRFASDFARMAQKFVDDESKKLFYGN